MTENYIVSNGTKSKTVARDRLMSLVHQGKVPESIFIKKEDGTDGFCELATVEWLRHDKAKPSCVRYCLECDARIKGTEASLSKPILCPACKKRSQLTDYFQITTEELPPPFVRFTSLPDFLAVAMAIFLGVLVLAASIAFFRDPVLSILLGFIMSVAGAGLFFYSVRHRAEAGLMQRAECG